jgi:hypothetical protein
MRLVGLSLAIVAAAALSARANIGDQWILGIHHIDNQGSFTQYVGGGYAGIQSSGNLAYVGSSWGRTGQDGVARVYWELSGPSVNNGNFPPPTAELYRLEFYGTTETGHNNWQPVESQFNGVTGEGFPFEAGIPWAGQFGTNHQYIAADGADDGLWHVLGPGPQADTNPPADGTMMWLKNGSWMYAKWNLGFDIDRTWSALRLTQITGVPEPSSMLLMLVGGVLVVARRGRRTA